MTAAISVRPNPVGLKPSGPRSLGGRGRSGLSRGRGRPSFEICYRRFNRSHVALKCGNNGLLGWRLTFCHSRVSIPSDLSLSFAYVPSHLLRQFVEKFLISAQLAGFS